MRNSLIVTLSVKCTLQNTVSQGVMVVPCLCFEDRRIITEQMVKLSPVLLRSQSGHSIVIPIRTHEHSLDYFKPHGFAKNNTTRDIYYKYNKGNYCE